MGLTAITLVAAGLGSMFGVISVEKIVDSDDLPPGVAGDFYVSESSAPCDNTVFFGGSVALSIGIYSASPQGLAVVANDSIPYPGTASSFERALHPTCAGSRMVFSGTDDVGPMTSGYSIFSFEDGTMKLLLERGSPLGNGVFVGSNSLDANPQYVAIDANLILGTSSEAIARLSFEEASTVVADSSTIMPGQLDPVTIMSRPIVDGAGVVFHARTAQQVGIYRWEEGQGLSLVADSNTPVPLPNQGSFGGFGLFVDLNESIVFEATYAGGVGLFLAGSNGLEPVVLPGDVTAEGATLASAKAVSGAGELLTFTGQTVAAPFDDVIYLRTPESELVRLVGEGDIVEGFPVWNVASNTDESDVLIWVQTIDFNGPVLHEYIYRARILAPTIEVPTVSWQAALMLVIGLSMVGWSRLRRQR